MDEGTYLERVTRVAHMMDVRTAFASNVQVQQALQVRRQLRGRGWTPQAEFPAAGDKTPATHAASTPHRPDAHAALRWFAFRR